MRKAYSKDGKKLETGGRYTPIGKYEKDKNYRPIVEKQFTAKFNGNEKTIKLTINIEVEDDVAYAGVFGYVGEGGEICKLGVAKGSYISASASGSTSYIGGIAGHASGEISGCYNAGVVSGSGYSYAGGIAGQAYGTITECTSSGAVSASGDISCAGGIAGVTYGAISGCYNTGKVSASGDYGRDAGGIAGVTYGTISGCYNTGEVSGRDAGGIAGVTYGTISGCYNTGEVSGRDAGGIAGEASGTISGCYNTGVVTASGGPKINAAGGIAGSAVGTISGCTSSGAVSATGENSCAGGIVGKADVGTITGCYYLVGCAEKAVGKEEENVEIKNVVALFAAEFYAEGLVEKLNQATKEAVEGLKSDALEEAKNISELDAAPTTLDEAKQKLEELKTEEDINNEQKAEKLREGIDLLKLVNEFLSADKKATTLTGAKSELEKKLEGLDDTGTELIPEILVMISCMEEAGLGEDLLASANSLLAEDNQATTIDDADSKLVELIKELGPKIKRGEAAKNLIAKIDVIKATLEALPADGKVFVYAFGRYPALWWEKVPSVELNLGHTRSGIGGQAGFYQAKNGVVTFRVVPNLGYKISRIVTSGSTIIKPGSVVKALPEQVMVRFEKA